MRRPYTDLNTSWKFLELSPNKDLTLLSTGVWVLETFLPCRDFLQFFLIVPYTISHTKDKILVLTIIICHGAARELSMLVKQILVLIDFLEAHNVPERFAVIIRSEYLLRKKFFPMLPSQKAGIHSVEVFSQLLG